VATRFRRGDESVTGRFWRDAEYVASRFCRGDGGGDELLATEFSSNDMIDGRV
jgi:hypothetical protein